MARLVCGNLWYTKWTDSWSIRAADGTVVQLQAGDAVTLGYLCGIAVRAALVRDPIDGSWSWATTTIPQMPFDGAQVTIRTADAVQPDDGLSRAD